MANAWYSSGTVSVENGNGVVTGVNTLFTLNAAPGDVFFGPDDKLYQIAAVTDDTHISIVTRAGQAAYQGSTLSAQPYAIIRNFTNSVNATLASKLTTLLNNWQTREDQFRTWHGGAANGGPSLDGNYPLTDAVGVSQNIACPAKLQLLAGGQVKAWAKAATTANITLSGNQTVDGVALITGDRCFVKDQSTGSQNGIYVVAAGAWSRASDFDVSADAFPQCLIPVEQGTTNADTIWMMTTNAPITLGSTTLAFTKVYPDPLKANVAGSASQAFSTAALTTNVPYSNTVTDRLGFRLITAGSTPWWNLGIAMNGDMTFDHLNGVNAERMRLATNGNVLIGTATDNGAGSKLQVNGGITATNLNMAEVSNTGNHKFLFSNGSSAANNLLFAGSADGHAYIQSYTGDGITGAQSLALQYLDGSVLIGTTTDNGSSAKLQVAGGITATLPTSSAGLPAGAMWRNGNVVNIV